MIFSYWINGEELSVVVKTNVQKKGKSVLAPIYPDVWETRLCLQLHLSTFLLLTRDERRLQAEQLVAQSVRMTLMFLGAALIIFLIHPHYSDTRSGASDTAGTGLRTFDTSVRQ